MNEIRVREAPAWDVHWLTWLLTIGLDTAIFGGNLGALAGYLLLLLLAVPFFVAVTLIQRVAVGDTWTAAVAKALALLVLVAIPTPVASVLGAAGSVLAALSRRGDRPGSN
jgi:hypothetical protein